MKKDEQPAAAQAARATEQKKPAELNLNTVKDQLLKFLAELTHDSLAASVSVVNLLKIDLDRMYTNSLQMTEMKAMAKLREQSLAEKSSGQSAANGKADPSPHNDAG